MQRRTAVVLCPLIRNNHLTIAVIQKVEEYIPTMTKKRPRNAEEDDDSAQTAAQKQSSNDRCDPKSRGIHSDAIRAEASSPSSRARCVDCNKRIPKDAPRWGIKYAGNPLPLPVIPLYGSHPMYMWCHGGCGLGFVRINADAMGEASRTCHACQDTPSTDGLRLLCGGSTNQQGKIRQHAFHIECWLRAMIHVNDESARNELVIAPSDIVSRNGGLSWSDLTADEQAMVQEAWNEYNV